MFTGIVEELGRVREWRDNALVIDSRTALEGTLVGDSIAVNGVCITVVAVEDGAFAFDVSPETARRSNLDELRPGDPVDLERPLPYGGRVGGHLVQGHVDGVGVVRSITPDGESYLFAFDAPPALMRYIVEKGFVTVDGISLTVAGREATAFTVAVIPYTHQNTVLGHCAPGDQVNIEVDILAKYAEQLLAARAPAEQAASPE